jgi:ATP-dependent DNA ligase
MQLRLVREPLDHPDYIFELKHDGFRAIAYLQHGESKLVSRNQRNLGFEALQRSLAKADTLRARSSVPAFDDFPLDPCKSRR